MDWLAFILLTAVYITLYLIIPEDKPDPDHLFDEIKKIKIIKKTKPKRRFFPKRFPTFRKKYYDL